MASAKANHSDFSFAAGPSATGAKGDFRNIDRFEIADTSAVAATAAELSASHNFTVKGKAGVTPVLNISDYTNEVLTNLDEAMTVTVTTKTGAVLDESKLLTADTVKLGAAATADASSSSSSRAAAGRAPPPP